jgi:endonuclease YncB( thermonuclease family)
MSSLHKKYVTFEAAWVRAVNAAKFAGEALTPRPMTVSEGAGGQSWYVSDGVCGFAWVTVSPGNSSFAKWLVKNGYARKAYEGGVCHWVSAFGQSMERKEAYARAMADMLRSELGVKAYPGSRMD